MAGAGDLDDARARDLRGGVADRDRREDRVLTRWCARSPRATSRTPPPACATTRATPGPPLASSRRSPFFAEHGEIVWTPAARAQHLTLVREVGPRVWDATQVLVDRDGENDWCIRTRVDLATGPLPEGPLVCVLDVGT